MNLQFFFGTDALFWRIQPDSFLVVIGMIFLCAFVYLFFLNPMKKPVYHNYFSLITTLLFYYIAGFSLVMRDQTFIVINFPFYMQNFESLFVSGLNYSFTQEYNIYLVDLLYYGVN